MKEIVIIGAGGHASVIVDIIESMISIGDDIKIKGLLDDTKNTKEFMGYEILDEVKNASLYDSKETEFIIAIGDNKIRKYIAEKLQNLKYFKAIHSTAIIGSRVKIEEGTVVMPKVIINANTTIGKHVIINSGCIVEHDNKIKNFAHISPGATLCGGVNIGKNAHIGANSTVIPYKMIGNNSIVGAGSVVISDIKSGTIVVGNPAKIIKNI